MAARVTDVSHASIGHAGDLAPSCTVLLTQTNFRILIKLPGLKRSLLPESAQTITLYVLVALRHGVIAMRGVGKSQSSRRVLMLAAATSVQMDAIGHARTQRGGRHMGY